MRELVVDLTPACVNRTAIHHIALDTYAALAETFEVTAQVLGERRQRPQGRAAEKAVTENFLRHVHRWATTSVHVDEIGLHVPEPQDRADRTPRLYFDPIYTLSRPLGEEDIVFVLDMSTLTNPEWHRSGVSVAYERAFRKLLASRARIVCISAHCATALRASFSIPRSDIVTVPLYLRALPSRALQQTGSQLEPGKFFLCVGSLETRKNLVGLMRAFALSGLVKRGWTLVIAGGQGEGHETIVYAAAELRGVELLGFVSDEVLAWLYANAAAFTYPSFLEGFGLPLLEAMSYGLPCLASVTGASREVCDGLAILVDPYDVPSIVDGLFACVSEASQENDEAKAKRRWRASQFSFQRYLDALMPAFGHMAA